MNLLEMLGGSLTQEASVNNISKKSGGSNAQIIKLVGIFLPLLLTYLTRNAKKKDGAKSLANALGQHTDKSSLSSQIQNADTDDGEKILKHILGDDEDEVTNNLAKQTGMDKSQVMSALEAMLPGIMSGISASATEAGKSQKSGIDLSDGVDLSDIMGMLGGSSSSSNKSSSGFGLDSILGMFGGSGSAPAKKKTEAKKEKKTTSTAQAELEKAKYEAEIAKANAEKAKAEAELAKLKAEQAKKEKASQKTSSGNASLEGLMGQLMGRNGAKEASTKKSAMDGSDLLSMLAGLM